MSEADGYSRDLSTKAEVAVDEAATTLKVTDDTTCIECDKGGNCTDCTDSPAVVAAAVR